MKYRLPKPLDDDLFEDMVCDVYSRIFKNPNLQRFGRRGQRQHGIDIIGKNYHNNQPQAIQCKCHPNETTKDEEIIKEINIDLARFDSSKIYAQSYIFITSSNNSTKVLQHVAEINSKRSKTGLCNIEVVFWEFLEKKLIEDTDLLYRYFFRLLPSIKQSDFQLPGMNQKNRTTLKLTYDDIVNESDLNSIKNKLLDNIKATQGEEVFNQTTEYILNLGLHSNNNDFQDVVDLDICFKSLFTDEENLEVKLQKLTEVLSMVCDLIQADKRISKQIVIYSDSEISFVFLLGMVLRRRKFKPIFVFKEQAWNVDNTELNHLPSEIKDVKPEVYNPEGKDVVFVYSCTPTFDFHTEKEKFTQLVEQNNPNIKFLLGYRSEQIKNSAHAFSISSDIAAKLNSLNTWGIEKVHLILIAPKPMAGLIGYQLNTLNIKVIPYFLNKKRDAYLSVGEITNNLLR